MRAPWISLLSTTLLAIALGTGCAPAEESKDSNGGGSAVQNDGVDNEIRTASDAAIAGKLKGILKDVTFTSESDYGYTVLEGEAVPAGTKRLNTALVRQLSSLICIWYSEWTAFFSRSTYSLDSSGAMKNCAKRSSAPSKYAGCTSKK